MARLSTAHRVARSTTSYATEQDRRASKVSVKHAIACPDCGADVGQSCTTPDGRPKTNHSVRVRLATRLHNQQMQNWDLVLWAKSVSFKERRAAKARSGLSNQDIADLLGGDLHRSTVAQWFTANHPPLTPAGAKFAAWLREQVPR